MLSRNVLSTCTRHSRTARLQFRTRSLATVSEAAGSSSTSSTPLNDKFGRPAMATIETAVILNRSPIITRTPMPFEAAYYAYHERIERALFNPFPDEFYFKPGSLIEGKFKAEERKRERLAFAKARFAKTKPQVQPVEAVATPTTATGKGIEAGEDEEKIEQPMPRVHDADLKGDVQSLDRQGERNLYLLVHGKGSVGKDVWRFPQGGVEGDQLLYKAAERDLWAECGELMDIWIVTPKPIGVLEPSNTSEHPLKEPQTYVFFFKAHILAGQAKPNGKSVKDFAWLTKQEIETRVDPQYWSVVKDMLSDF